MRPTGRETRRPAATVKTRTWPKCRASSFELTLPDAEVRPPTDTPDADVRDWARRNTNVFPIDDGFRAELSEVCAVGATGPNTGNVTGSSKTFTTAAAAEAWVDDFAADSVL